MAAALDSVKAILRRLSYLVLSNNYNDLGKVLPRCFESEKSFDTAKGQLIKGNGLGKGIIHAYDSSLGLGAIQTSINTLKANGSFKEVLEETEAKILAETTAQLNNYLIITN